MKKRFKFNNEKKRFLGSDNYLVHVGLRPKRVIAIVKAKKTVTEINALKEVKKMHTGDPKMLTLLKTHCNG